MEPYIQLSLLRTLRKKSVRRALEGEKVVADNIKFFWAKWVRDPHDIWKHLEPAQTIGVHHFATDWIN